MTDYSKLSIEKHRNSMGKIEIKSKLPLKTIEDLSVAYTPGVGAVCLEIEKNKKLANYLTSSKNTVAVVTDGTAVLGLGDIGPQAALPVMEGKAVLFKEFGGVDAFPIALDTKDPEKIVETVKLIAPTFGGINLEDISAPRCFEIEERLKEELDIPVFHDDQHGTAIVVLAGLINSLKIIKKKKDEIKVVINGSGAAGVAITKLLYEFGVRDMVVCDSRGIVSKGRENLNGMKEKILEFTNKRNISGSLKDALKGSDVFIGVSKANLLSYDDVKNMNKDPIIFAMANPIPEIMPDVAKEAGAKIVATGRSDFANQINNVLVFPGIFKGAMEARVKIITEEMKLKAAKALAEFVRDPNVDKIIPSPFDKGVANVVAKSIIDCNLK